MWEQVPNPAPLAKLPPPWMSTISCFTPPSPSLILRCLTQRLRCKERTLNTGEEGDLDSKHICSFRYVLDLFEEEKQCIHKLKSCYVLTHSSSGFSNTNCHRQTTIKLYEVKVFPLAANTGINSTPNTQVEAKEKVAEYIQYK